jgi:hypothetical protein
MSAYTRKDYDLDLPEDGTYACGLIFMDEASEQASRLAMSLLESFVLSFPEFLFLLLESTCVTFTQGGN